MQAIAPTIKPDDSGPQVRNLYEALRFLIERGVFASLDPSKLAVLSDQLRSEQPSGSFQGAAVALVQQFQRQEGLIDDGIVEAETAAKLNALLKEYGSLQDADAYVVEGRVVDERERPLAGIEVSLFDEDVTGPQRLGEPKKTGPEGRYRFTFSKDDYLEGDFGQLAQPDSGARNRFYAALLRPNTPVIVPSGPDIWVGLGSDPKSAQARTEIIFNAGKATVMADLVVTKAIAGASLSDLERVIGLVSPRLKGLSIAALSGSQIEFLSQDCEEPIALIRALVIAVLSDEEASALADRFGLGKPDGLELGLLPLQFGLAVDDSESNLQRVFALGDADVVRSLQEGIAQNRIPQQSVDDTEALLSWLRELRALYRLAEKGDNQPASPGQLLATMPDALRLKDEALMAVARAMDHWNTDPEQFVAAVRDAGIDDRQLNAVLRTLSLGDLTGAHVPLIRLLQEDDPAPEQAALVDLAQLGRQEWTKLVTTVGPPPGSGDGPAATDGYVTTLIRGMELRAPTAFVLARVADGRIEVEPKLLEPAVRFFGNNPDFRIGTDSVLTRFGQDKAAEGVNDDQAQPLLQQLLKIERITRVAPNLEAAELVLSGGFNSALEITNVRLDDFVDQMKDTLPGGIAEAVEIHERARNVVDMAFGIVMSTSSSFNREGEIALLSGTSSTSSSATSTASGASSTTGTSSTSSPATAAQQAQTATLEVLFGSQDACACEPCSAMGSPSHYLAELLMLLDRSDRNAANRTPLDVLLDERPDIAEIEFDCDNSGHVVPYVDLLLEMLEAPIIEEAPLNVIPRSSISDTELDRGSVPTSLIAEFRRRAGIDLGVNTKATIISSQAPKRWLVRGNGWRLILRYSTLAAYRFRIFPQSGRTGMPESWSFPSQHMAYAYSKPALARYPWSLPFDLAAEETDIWLRQFGTNLGSSIELCAGPYALTSLTAAGFALSISSGELNILTQEGSAGREPWRDWGYEGTSDPQVVVGTRQRVWYEALRTVSLLRSRAGISHADLLQLIQCRFIQTSPGLGSNRLMLSGDECDSDNMWLGDPPDGARLTLAALRRIHIFIRIWRRLGWSMFDLDRAVASYSNPTSDPAGVPPGSGSYEVFTEEFIVHLANVVRLCEATALTPDLAIGLFTSSLDTQAYWRQDGSRAIAIPSTYESLYGDPSLSRPRTPDFELNAARTELRREPLLGQLPQLRLSDHVSVIAAAVGCSAADVQALLPQGEASIAAVELAATQQNGIGIVIPAAGEVVIELVSGSQPANSSFELRFQAPDANGDYTVDVLANQFLLDGNPITTQVITWSVPPPEGSRIVRYVYAPAGQRLQRLRVQAQRTSPSGSTWLSARVITAPGLVTDELNLNNLSLLTRHLLFARACKLDGATYRNLLDISGSAPLSGPRQALEFLEQVRRLRGLGLNAISIDELLRERFSDARSREQAQAHACEVLEALRRELAADDSDLSEVPGQAGELLRKVLVEAAWPERLVALVMGPEFLGRSYKSQHSAKLDAALPQAVKNQLSGGLEYVESQKELRWSHAPNASKSELEGARRRLLASFQPVGTAEQGKVEVALNELTASVEAVDIEINSTTEQKRAAELFRLAQSLELSIFFSEVIPALSVSVVRSISIPKAWSETLWFDTNRNRLCFRGPMTAGWRDELKRLSSEPAYLNAIDAIFNQASTHPEPAPPSFIEPASTSSFDTPSPSAARNLLFGDKQNLDQRAQVLLQRLLPIMRIRRATKRVIDVLAPRLNVSPEVASAFVATYRHAESGDRPLVGQGLRPGLLLEPAFINSSPTVQITPSGFEPQYTALRRLFKLSALAKASQLNGTETAWLMGQWPGSQGPDFSTLPIAEATGPALAWSSWKKWTTLLAARQQIGQTAGVLTGYAQAVTASSSFDAALRNIAVWAGLPLDEVKTLARGLTITTIAQLQEPARAQQLVECIEWIAKVGCDAASLIDWGTKPSSMAGAARARQFARAKLGEAAWPEASRQPLDALRVKRRDALVTYEVHRRGLRDANDLYSVLLVDPEMGPCMKTTRIRLAISSVQLFVQRVLLGLEKEDRDVNKHVSPAAIESKEWAWMQNYRMWEANLMVVLNSENYIDMSLRRDKTPPYRAVEADLMQGDVSDARAKAALTSYLDELEQISRLQTVGMYRNTPRNANGDPIWDKETLYFVGATKTQPRSHYVRRYIKQGQAPAEGRWTAWELVDLDLQQAEYVAPTVFKGELWLFWIDFREKADTPDLQTIPAKGAPPTKYWDKTLRWSRLRQDKWSSPKSLDLSATQVLGADFKKDTVLLVPEQSLAKKIRWRLEQLRLPVGTIEVDSNEASIRPWSLNIAPPPGETTALAWSGSNTNHFTLNSQGNDVEVFGPVPSFRATVSNQDGYMVHVFRAPNLLTSPRSIPLQFSFDTGNGEVLAQPYWHYTFNLVISTAYSSFSVVSVPRLHFSSLHHAHASEFMEILRQNDVSELLSIGTQQLRASNWFSDLTPNSQTIPESNYPELGVDFSPEGSYSAYNAELFFMIPFAFACELSKQQRFRESREWFHFVFNPTTSATTPGGGPERYWNYLPFRQSLGTASIQSLVQKLADPADQSREKRDFLVAIAQWRVDPFDPHLVARMRPESYKMAVVIAYIKNLIAWGDQLFRRDTMESLNEAAQFYILAAQIIGRPGEVIPPRTRPLTKAFTELRSDIAISGTNGLTNPRVAAESVLPVNSVAAGGSSNSNLPKTLYFCVPANPVFKELRQTVQDRLFKMRNCMNIDGVARELALFEPPIDPMALVKARAAGVDVGALLADVSAPPPIYRFAILVQKASEVCSEVKSLGAALLAAIEKGDGEALARLRSGHELRVLSNVRDMKKLQIDEAKAALEALDPALESAQMKLGYYTGLLTQLEDLAIPSGPAGPTVASLVSAALQTVSSTLTVTQVLNDHVDPISAAATEMLKKALARATDAISSAGDTTDPMTAKVPMNLAEKRQLAELHNARENQNKANDLRLVAQLLAKIPDFKLGASGVASPVVTAELGGSLLSAVANFSASMKDAAAAEHSYRANLNSILSSYQRRAAEWTQQANAALIDIKQISKQMATAAVKAAIAAQDLRNHDDQIANATEVDEFYRSKWSNQELYGWMSQQLSSVYYRSYQLAYDLAKRAERAYRHELGLDSSDFVRFGHWDGMKKGLLSGELLYHDIKRMEAAYFETNARELEITRSISLRQLDGAKLMDLRISGQCSFDLPEWLFNMDYPDHYMRRIKSVTVSLPCVVGPYTGVSGKLTMLSGRVRSSPTPGAGYNEDSNFRSINLASTSIAVSSAQGDSGLFEFNLRDERFLPFEGGGLVGSQWRFELPQHLRQFDYETISDLVLTIRYTARSSTALRQPAVDALNARWAASAPGGLLIDVKRDFPTEWALALAESTVSNTTFKFIIEPFHFPYAFAYRGIKVLNDGHMLWRRYGANGAWAPLSTLAFSPSQDGDKWKIEFSQSSIAKSSDEVLLCIMHASK
jgi:hypothetical protein